MTSNQDLLDVIDLQAELDVLEAYDAARGRQPFDMTAGRRTHRINRVTDAVAVARKRAGLPRAGLELAGGVDLPIAELHVARARAFDREARRLIQRADVRRAVVIALETARLALGVPTPAVLAAALERDDLNAPGASRARPSFHRPDQARANTTRPQ